MDLTNKFSGNNLDLLPKVYEHPFGVKEYFYPNRFTYTDIENVIDYLNQKFYNVNNIKHESPGLQTPGEFNLFLEEPFQKLKETYLKSVENYVNQKKLIDNLNLGKYNIFTWCYMNWKSSGRQDDSPVWHIHNPMHPNSITGVFYLKLPKTNKGETKFHIGGNEFELPSRELSWFLFPSTYLHAPGEIISNQKRYVLSVDIWFDETHDKIKVISGDF